jgi:ribosomal protein L37E
MSYTYCKECGHKNLYATQPPKYCGHCGSSLSFSSAAKTTLSPSPVSSRKKRTRILEEVTLEKNQEFSNIEEVPSIRSFKYSASSDGYSSRKIKLKDLVNLEEAAKIEEGQKLKENPTEESSA